MIGPRLALSVLDEIAPAVATPERTDEDMSTPHPLNSPTTPPTPPGPPKAIRLDLSVTKILGGALAAMTAAALGSRLSVAGTVVGAAIASIIAAVASALYTASLSRTHEKVRTVFTGRTDGAHAVGRTETAADLTRPVPSTTTGPATGTVVWDEPADAAAHHPSTAAAGTNGAARRLNWKGIVIGALAAFAVAAAALTAIELVSGRALSGGDGTTITQVSGGGGAAASTEDPTASPTPSQTPSSEPSASASETPEPSDEPSSTPAPTPEPSAAESSAEPAPSAPLEPSSRAMLSPSPGGGPGQGTAPKPRAGDSTGSSGG